MLYAIAIATALGLISFQAAFAEVSDIAISEVEFRDIGGRSIDSPPSGRQLMLSATLINNSTQSISYVAFIELRDSNGVTLYLEFHKGNLDPDASSNVASSWTPDTTGGYELRVFAINDFENPEILSAIGTVTTVIT